MAMLFSKSIRCKPENTRITEKISKSGPLEPQDEKPSGDLTQSAGRSHWGHRKIQEYEFFWLAKRDSPHPGSFSS